MTFTLLQKSEVTKKISLQINELFKQLNSNIEQLEIKKVLDQQNEFVCLCCWDKNNLIGMASLATYKVISGYKGIVEDVVVSSNQRGQGLGKKLMEQLISEGQKLNLTEIILFTGHHRKPAISLYKSLGFILKNSGMYTLKL